MFFKQREINLSGIRLLCLLFIALMMTGWFCPVQAETFAPTLNASGNWNIKPAADPFDESEDYSAVLYDNLNGLPTSQANAIAQTEDGFIWIGSYAGLIRYDGNTFERMTADTPISNVKELFIDSHNRLWIGTNDAGFLMMEKGQIRRWGRADGLQSLYVRDFAEDKDGYIYVGTTSGIAYFDPQLEFTGEDTQLFEGTVHNLRAGEDGLVYALSRDGDMAGIEKGKRVSFLSAEESHVEDLNCMLPDPEKPGWFWLGSMYSNIYYGQMSNAFEDAVELDTGDLTEVARLELIDGKMWVCARNGIGRIDEDGITQLKEVPMNDSVTYVMTDFQGNLWFTSSRQGVMKLIPNRFEDLFAKWDLAPQVINSTCIWDSMLFLGTDEGLSVFKDGKKVDRIPLKKAVTASGKDLGETDLLDYLNNVRIRSIRKDSKGRLWICAWTGDGLVCYTEGEMVVYTLDDGMASEKCRVIYECEDGTLLTAHSTGLSVIRDDRVDEAYSMGDGITNAGVLTVTEGFDGEYIIGTDGGGMDIINSGEVTHLGAEDGLGSDVVMRLSRSRSKDLIWIITGNCLAYMTPDYKVTPIKNFPYSNNYDLHENSKGELWVLSSDGIYVAPVDQMIADDEIETVHFNIFNGLPYVATSNSYSELTEEGDLYIAGTSGVARVNIEVPFEDDVDMKIAVPFVYADGRRIWPDSLGEFRLPSKTHKLTVCGFVLNYAPVNPKVSYCLEGFDSEPITVLRNELTPVDYTNLSGGEYRFTMSLENEAGKVTRKLSVTIVKELALYEQPWLWILVVICVLAIELWLIRYFMKRQAKRIEKKKDEERIAGDLRLASEIQVAALPHNSFTVSSGNRVDLFASMNPAKEVGGDFYDYYMVDDDHLAMVIADVSGKGMPAALFMMVSKVLIKNELTSGLSPAQALANANMQLCENNESGMFVTVWAAVLEISTGKGLACNAGHENPGIRLDGENFELALYKHNVFLGVNKNARYVDRSFELKPGDSVFVYTDGVPEARDMKGNMFGPERLEKALNINPDAAPEALIENVRKSVEDFAGGAEQFDDITMLAFNIT